MSLKTTKRISYVVLALYYFMGGVEYAVILPTMWLYIKTKFHAEKYILGILLSAYSLAALIASPIYGRWVDRSRKPKLILLFSTLWQMGGSSMYFMGISEWFVLGSRLVAGIGAGAESLILAEITRVTTDEERTGLISTMISMRQMGLLVGPGLNLFLRLANFNLGPFLIDKYTVPGMIPIAGQVSMFKVIFSTKPIRFYVQLCLVQLENVLPEVFILSGLIQIIMQMIFMTWQAFMACLWLMQGFVILILYTDLHKIKQMELKAAEEIQNYSPDSKYEIINESSRPNEVDYNSIQHSDYQREEIKKETDKTLPHEDDVKAPKLTLKLLYNEYVREEIIVIFSVQFNSFFNQIALETMATPLSDKLLHWGEVENSIMYCLAGVEVILVFAMVRVLSKHLKDRTMILFGAIILTLANGWLMYIVPRASPDEPTENIPKFAAGIILDMLALPFLAVCSVSLYSKITRKETQGLSQGIRRSIVGLSAILAPLWAGSTIDMPYVMFGVNMGLISMSVIMLIVSFHKLKPENQTESHISQPENTHINTADDETQPLLS